MMKHTTKRDWAHVVQVRVHLLVVLSCLVLAVLGRMPDSSRGWVSCPARAATVVEARRDVSRRRLPSERKHRWGRKCWRYVFDGWQIPMARSGVVWMLWLVSGGWGPRWLIGLPWLVWLWQRAELVWPWLRGQPEWRLTSWLLWQGQRLVLVGYLGLALSKALGDGARKVVHLPFEAGKSPPALVMGLGCVVCGGEGQWVGVERQADGSYRAELCGHFSLQVAGDDPFRARVLMLALRLLEEVGPQRRGGRTRDGRAPFVRQVQMTEWFGIPQPNVSRIEGYWLAGDWANLLSLKSEAVLTPELRERVVQVFAAFPWWRMETVYSYLREEGVAVSYDQVRQAAQESGWRALRQGLQQRYHFSAEDFRPRDGWLVSQLLSMVDTLLVRLEARGRLTPEEQMALSQVQTLAAEVEAAPQPPLKTLPWLLRVEQVLFGQWQAVDDRQVRCIYCGSAHVVRKSKQPRWKKYYDAQGQLQTVAVYRYYCRNQACDQGSFTHLPAGLVPYSRYRTETKLLAVQMYAWGYSLMSLRFGH